MFDCIKAANTRLHDDTVYIPSEGGGWKPIGSALLFVKAFAKHMERNLGCHVPVVMKEGRFDRFDPLGMLDRINESFFNPPLELEHTMRNAAKALAEAPHLRLHDPVQWYMLPHKPCNFQESHPHEWWCLGYDQQLWTMCCGTDNCESSEVPLAYTPSPWGRQPRTESEMLRYLRHGLMQPGGLLHLL